MQPNKTNPRKKKISKKPVSTPKVVCIIKYLYRKWFPGINGFPSKFFQIFREERLVILHKNLPGNRKVYIAQNLYKANISFRSKVKRILQQ